MSIERRRSLRRDVLETFQVFLVIPSKGGLRRIYLRDLSEHGLAFEAEAEDLFKSGDIIEADFHLNPGLKIPLIMKAAHLKPVDGGAIRVGAEFADLKAEGYKVYLMFLKFMDELGKLNPPQSNG